ncbi:MAG: hypothetical protein IEMM0008_1359 [bacterium]|nr:MAG: hypothetical protein IEMM0008_1359 [bacterium]
MNQYDHIKVCLFDFDGTLVDTMDHFADLAASIIDQKYTIPFDKARKDYLQTSGIPFFQQLEVLFPDKKENSVLADEFEEKKKGLFFSEHFSKDTIETMEGLKKHGLQIAISSGNFKDLVNEFLAHENLQFHYILGFEKNFEKGEAHFHFIQKQTGCTKRELLFVGDSLKDAEKAAEYGVPFIGKLGTFARSDFLSEFPSIQTIEKLGELMEILKL